MAFSLFAPVNAFAQNDTGNSVDQDALPDGYVDNSNEGMFQLQEIYEEQPDLAQIMATSDISGKKVEIAFLIDASGSMGPYIAKVKENVTAFAQYLESQGVNLRMAVIRFGSMADGNRATVLKINGSSWHTSTEQLVQTLSSIPADGGTEALSDAIGDILHNDPATSLPNIFWSSDAYKFAFALTNDFDTGVEGLLYNDYGYPTLDSTIPDLQAARIPVTVVTGRSYFSRYTTITSQTEGELYDIASADYLELMINYANRIMGIALKQKKAIYVLPGYMGSRLYTSDGQEYWVDEKKLGDDITDYILWAESSSKKDTLRLDSNGENSKVHVDMTKDLYGTPIDGHPQGTYYNLVEKLKTKCSGYDVIFFPYNWLADLNDSATDLKNHINKNGYDKVVFVTHSTGGLLASTYIAKSHANKLKVEKAILIAPPLFGTYASLNPLETGKEDLVTDKVKEQLDAAWYGGVASFLGAYSYAYQFIRKAVHNSPTTYQLLPSVEYLRLMPQIYEDEFNNNAVTTTSEYYKILNGSSNINPKLTNGGSRSHETLRNSLGNVVSLWDGDVVSSLQEVDTVLVGTSSGHLTWAIAKYKSKLFGGTELTDITKKWDGDGTILDVSSFALSTGKKHVLNYKDFASDGAYGHTGLATETKPIQYVCDYINDKFSPSPISAMGASLISSEPDGMPSFIKINYNSNAFVSVNIFDEQGVTVAQISENKFFGFDGDKFDFTPLTFTDEKNNVVIYIPNQRYKIVFSYGNEAGVPIDFSIEISTLDADGSKDISVSRDMNATTEDGVLAVLDGTTQKITSDNIDKIFNGSVTEHYTDWDLPETLNVNYGDISTINLVGSQADDVLPLLNWSTSDDSIVDVTADGTITAKDYGWAIIAATDGNKSSTCKVTVVQNATSINLSDIQMLIDERTLIRPTFVPEYTTEKDMTYVTDADDIIEIDNFGVIHALKVGNVVVTGTAPGGATDTFTVTVTDDTVRAVQSVSIDPDNATVRVDAQTSFTANVLPANATNKTVTWLIEDTTIAEIVSSPNSACVVKGLKEGSTKLFAITIDGGYTAEVQITVSNTSTPPPPPSTTTYTITASAGVNGSISPSGAVSVTRGSSRTFTLTANTGYKTADVLVDGKSVGAVATYTFSNVTANHSISATFARDDENINDPDTPLGWLNPYDDVVDTDWFHDAVRFVTIEKLMNGTSARLFSPNATMTRAMLVTVLYRQEGKPVVSGDMPFSDVKKGEWYSDAILWASQNDIVNGYGSGKFGLNDPVTREQAVTILYRYAKVKGLDVSASADLSKFIDKDNISDWALDAMKWAVAEGIIQGRTATTTVPQGTSTRAEVAMIFKRYIEDFLDAGGDDSDPQE